MESMSKNYNPYQTFENMLDNMHEDGVSMMIFHPGYLDAFILANSSLLVPRTQEVAMLIDSNVKQQIIERDIECIDYRKL